MSKFELHVLFDSPILPEIKSKVKARLVLGSGLFCGFQYSVFIHGRFSCPHLASEVTLSSYRRTLYHDRTLMCQMNVDDFLIDVF